MSPKQLGVAVSGFFVLLSALVVLEVQLMIVNRKLESTYDLLQLTQELTPGRGEAAVHAIMGKPDFELTDEIIAGVSYPRVIVYRSRPESRQGNADIWIAIEDGRIATVYYPDRSIERRLVNNEIIAPADEE